MGKYTLTDFTKGDAVFHLSNTNLIMVVIEIHPEINEVTCRWLDKVGNIQIVNFMPEELGKKDDLRRKISVRAI